MIVRLPHDQIRQLCDVYHLICAVGFTVTIVPPAQFQTSASAQPRRPEPTFVCRNERYSTIKSDPTTQEQPLTHEVPSWVRTFDCRYCFKLWRSKAPITNSINVGALGRAIEDPCLSGMAIGMCIAT